MLPEVIPGFRHLLAGLFVLLSATLHGADFSLQIKQGAERCAQAVQRKDWNTYLALAHPRAIKVFGGKQAVLSLIRQSEAEMQSKGLVVEKIQIGMPKPVRKSGTWLSSLVPEALTMKAPLGHLEASSYLLALSEDGGKTWRYLDLGLWDRAELLRAFPELQKLSLPEIAAPSYRLD